MAREPAQVDHRALTAVGSTPVRTRPRGRLASKRGVVAHHKLPEQHDPYGDEQQDREQGYPAADRRDAVAACG